jgi:hypothetical protein
MAQRKDVPPEWVITTFGTFLSLRHPPRWDLYAERFALAITLYEMVSGDLEMAKNLQSFGGV